MEILLQRRCADVSSDSAGASMFLKSTPQCNDEPLSSVDEETTMPRDDLVASTNLHNEYHLRNRWYSDKAVNNFFFLEELSLSELQVI